MHSALDQQPSPVGLQTPFTHGVYTKSPQSRSDAQHDVPLHLSSPPAQPHAQVGDAAEVAGQVLHATSGHVARQASSSTQVQVSPTQRMHGPGSTPWQPVTVQVSGSTVPSGHTHTPLVHVALAGEKSLPQNWRHGWTSPPLQTAVDVDVDEEPPVPATPTWLPQPVARARPARRRPMREDMRA